jgi:predicted DNA-binding protein with PD1-like motif
MHVPFLGGFGDGSAVAGRLQRAEVRPTLEVILTEPPEYLRKKHNPEVGLGSIKPDL